MSNVQHPLGSDPKTMRMSEERLKELALRAKGGALTEEDRSEIANGFIRLALKIASGYARSNPTKGDDFASAGLFGIVHALTLAGEKIAEYQENEPDVCPGRHLGKWIVWNIHRMINEFRVNDHMVRVPDRTIRHEAKQGVELKFIPNGLRSEVRVDPQFLEIMELMDKASLDDVDKQIVELRIEGHKDDAIAEMLCISKPYVYQRRMRICERYLQLERN